MKLHRLHRVVRAARRKAAAARTASGGAQHRAEDPLINPNQKANDPNEESAYHGEERGGENSPKRRACWIQSFSNSAKLALAALPRAMVIK